MDWDINLVLKRALGCLQLQNSDGSPKRSSPVLLANPSFFLKHDLRPNALILAASPNHLHDESSFHVVRLWPSNSIGKGCIGCSVRWHPLTAHTSLELYGPVDAPPSEPIVEIKLGLRWLHSPSTSVDQQDTVTKKSRGNGELQRKVLSPAMRMATAGVERGRSRGDAAAHPAQQSAPVCFLRSGVPGPRLSNLLERLLQHRLSGWELLAGSSIPMELLGMRCTLDVLEMHGRDRQPGFGLVTWRTVFHIEQQGAIRAENDDQDNDKLSWRRLEGLFDPSIFLGVQRALMAGLKLRARPSSMFGGYAGQLSTLRKLIILPFKDPEVFRNLNIAPPKGILLHGPPGTGKTMLASRAAQLTDACVFVLNGGEFITEITGESEALLKAIFKTARLLQPSIIFFDELDSFAGGRQTGGGPSRAGTATTRLISVLINELDKLQGHQVIVLGGTNHLDAIDLSLRRPGRFDSEVDMPPPSAKERQQILQRRFQSLKHSLSEDMIVELANKAHGYVGADLHSLANQSALCALRRYRQSGDSVVESVSILPKDLEAAWKAVRPSALREVSLEIPLIKWDDIGGQDDIKQRIREAVELPFKDASVLQKYGGIPPKGILLYGPPGCSKTMLAQAVANEAGLGFLSVKGSELYSKYVGESEKAVVALFKRARAAQPAVIFFDELDGLVGARSEEGAEQSVGDRVISQLLQELDGVAERETVIVIGATNRVDCLDPALLRPGRFDRLIEVPLPDLKTRLAILRLHTQKMPLGADVQLSELGKETAGYSGADIESLCQQAGFKALEKDVDANVVTWHDFRVVLDDWNSLR